MVIKPAMEIRQSDDLGFPSQSQSFMSFFRMTRHMLPILIARVGLSALSGHIAARSLCTWTHPTSRGCGRQPDRHGTIFPGIPDLQQTSRRHNVSKDADRRL